MLYAILLAACTGDGGRLFGRGDGDGNGTGGGIDTDDSGSDTDGEPPDVTPLPDDCSPLGAPTGPVVSVSPTNDLAARVAAAEPYTTFLLEDGVYALTGGDAADELTVRARGVTVRSASGDPEAVVLDGGYATTELIAVEADDVTIAELTLRQSYGAAIAVRGARGTRLFRVNVREPGAEALRAEASRDGAYADDGVVACASFTRETWCGTAVDLLQAEGWLLRDSAFEQPLCPEPAVRVATGSRGTRIERSTFSSLSIALQLGDTEYAAGAPRRYDGAECEGDSVGHYGGVVRNVFVRGGLRLEEACGARVSHVSVWGGDLAWAFSQDLVVRNALAAVNDTGGADVAGQLRPSLADFVDPASGDLHLAPRSFAHGAGVPIDAGEADTDFDGEPRPLEGPDVGADEAADR
jgi:hypothetical protein